MFLRGKAKMVKEEFSFVKYFEKMIMCYLVFVISMIKAYN